MIYFDNLPKIAGDQASCSGYLSKQFDETRMAIRLVILLFKSSFVQLLQTKGADEVLRVELAVHGGDAATRDGFLTAVTKRSSAGMVVHLTVRSPFVFKETAARKSLVTLLCALQTINQTKIQKPWLKQLVVLLRACEQALSWDAGSWAPVPTRIPRESLLAGYSSHHI